VRSTCAQLSGTFLSLRIPYSRFFLTLSHLGGSSPAPGSAGFDPGGPNIWARGGPDHRLDSAGHNLPAEPLTGLASDSGPLGLNSISKFVDTSGSGGIGAKLGLEVLPEVFGWLRRHRLHVVLPKPARSWRRASEQPWALQESGRQLSAIIYRPRQGNHGARGQEPFLHRPRGRTRRTQRIQQRRKLRPTPTGVRCRQ
jgi:hypothetical protein